MSDLKPVPVGVIGCGNISGAYMRMLKTLPAVTVVACADALPAAATAFAEQHGVAQALSVAELLAHPAIEIVLNLTTPQAHGEIALAAERTAAARHPVPDTTLTALIEARRVVDDISRTAHPGSTPKTTPTGEAGTPSAAEQPTQPTVEAPAQRARLRHRRTQQPQPGA